MAAHQLLAELDGFLMEAEGCLVDIERSLCDVNDVAALDGVLQQAEWLLRCSFHRRTPFSTRG